MHTTLHHVMKRLPAPLSDGAIHNAVPELPRIPIPGTLVYEGCEENLASPVKKMSHLKFCHGLRRIHRQFIVGGLNGIA